MLRESDCQRNVKGKLTGQSEQQNGASEFSRIASERERLYDSLDCLLLTAVIRKEINIEEFAAVKRIKLRIQENKDVLNLLYDQAILIEAESLGISERLFKFAVTRIMSVIVSLANTHYLKGGLIRETTSTRLFHFSKAIPLMKEAFSLFPSDIQPVGIQVDEANPKIVDATFFFHRDNVLQKFSVSLSNKESEIIEQERREKKVLIAVEGDIAGHAIRALQTARGLRSVGYEPDVIGNGYYMSSFAQEGFHLLPYIGTDNDIERERIVASAKGEKGAGLFFWSFATVRNRVEQLMDILRPYLSGGIDLFISDMNLLADSAVQRVKSEEQLDFPCLTQTHDVGLSGHRVLNSVRINGIPIGSTVFRLESNALVRMLLTDQTRTRINCFLFDQVANVFMGLPLSVNDQLYTIKRRKKIDQKENLDLLIIYKAMKEHYYLH